MKVRTFHRLCVASMLDLKHNDEDGVAVQFEVVEWDDRNLGHLKRATAAEVEQAIANADEVFPHRTVADRRVIRSETKWRPTTGADCAIARRRPDLRPITAWEDE